jgi:hypothetical protein
MDPPLSLPLNTGAASLLLRSTARSKPCAHDRAGIEYHGSRWRGAGAGNKRRGLSRMI